MPPRTLGLLSPERPHPASNAGRPQMKWNTAGVWEGVSQYRRNGDLDTDERNGPCGSSYPPSRRHDSVEVFSHPRGTLIPVDTNIPTRMS